jgi:DNA-binding NarL/FixJ family response regulator
VKAERVLLAEDHEPVREAVAAEFGHDPDFEIIGHAASLAEARRMLHSPEVVILDLGLPHGSGADLVAELQAVDHPVDRALVPRFLRGRHA